MRCIGFIKGKEDFDEMKSMKRGMAVLLAALLMVPAPPARAEGTTFIPGIEAGEDSGLPVTAEDLAVKISGNAQGAVDGTGSGEGSGTAADEGAEQDDPAQAADVGAGADGESDATGNPDGAEGDDAGSGNGAEEAADDTDDTGAGSVAGGDGSGAGDAAGGDGEAGDAAGDGSGAGNAADDGSGAGDAAGGDDGSGTGDATGGNDGSGAGDAAGDDGSEAGDAADGSTGNGAGDGSDSASDAGNDAADGANGDEDDAGAGDEAGDGTGADSDSEPDGSDADESEKEDGEVVDNEEDDLKDNEGEEGDDMDQPSEELSEWDGNGILFSTGGEYRLVVEPGSPALEEYAEIADAFSQDGSYTIRIPEEDPFFPYEVQFADPEFEEVENVWFMTPDSTVEFGGHTFRVEADFTGNVVTQLSLNIAGDTVIIYPEEKTFGGAAPISLLPLKEVYLGGIDVTGYTPLELTMVSIGSIFTGHAELTDTDRIMWTTSYSSNGAGPDYTISQAGDCINLSYASSFQMIVGEPDQLAADNVRYLVNLSRSSSEGWLMPLFYGQDEDGTRTEVVIKRDSYYSYDEYGYENIYLSSLQGIYKEGYLALGINTENYVNTKFTTVKAFEGHYKSAQEAMAATEVTDKIFCTDMTQKDTGYKMSQYTYSYITLVSFDGQGNVTGCLPVILYYDNLSSYISVNSLYTADGSYVPASSSIRYEDGCNYYTLGLYPDNPVDRMYAQGLTYYLDGERDNSAVTAAYVGLYSSIAEAREAAAENIKGELFGTGYVADYSEGIFFTVFVGEDGAEGQRIYKYNFKVVEREEVPVDEPEDYVDDLNSGTAVQFGSLRGGEGRYVASFALQDSYAENNYIVYLVNEDVDRSNLAPTFTIRYEGLKLYAEGSSAPEVSGESYHDFSKGPVQYTASSEDKSHSKNYWVQVVTKEEAAGQIFMNSLADPDVTTSMKDGTVYTTREVMLDSLHSYKHDIMLANMGAQAIEGLAAELVSDSLELDDYWTLNGNHELSGFTTTNQTTSYGKLSNLAMLRLRRKADVADGVDVSGTLTIKSGETVLMVITLTGTVGDPTITTTEIPEAVKYVPYGTMIQSSNKYSWNEVTFELASGALPGGMVIKPNGELYGVPTEAGEFTFSVRMHNSHGGFSDRVKEFTMVVKENTDENVDNATDENYELTERVAYLYDSSLGDQTMVSQGEFGEFVDLWLDGVKLEKGVDYDAESGSTRVTIYSQTLDGQGEGTHTLGIEFRSSDTDDVKAAAQNYVIESDDPDDDKPGEDNPDDNKPGEDDPDDNKPGEDNPDDNKPGEDDPDDNKPGGNTPGGNRPGGNTPGGNRPGGNTSGNGSSSGNTGSAGNSGAAGGSGSNSGAAASGVSTVVEPGTSSVTYTVERGDTLWKIAVKFYGDGNQWRKIYEDNRNILSDPNKIYAGQVLVIRLADSAEGQDGAAAGQGNGAGSSAAGGTYTVQPGDSLWKIAAKVYGNGRRWRQIYEANADRLPDASRIYAGQVLVIPE